MIKTEIFVVCDKCEIPFKNGDLVYGHARYENCINEVILKDYYFCEGCFDDIKRSIAKNISSKIESLISTNYEKSHIEKILIPYISEYYTITTASYPSIYEKYFIINIDSCDSMIIKAYIDDFSGQWITSGAVEAVEKIMSYYFEKDSLGNLRDKYKKEQTYRNNIAQIASSCCYTSSTEGILERITTYN